VARALLAFLVVAAPLALASGAAHAADPPALAPSAATTARPAGRAPLIAEEAPRGDEATLRTGEPPKRLERVESENRPPPSVRFSTILGGVALGAAWWGLGTASAYALPDDPGMKDLRTPLAGPWLAISNNRCDGACSVGDIARYVWFSLNGIGQVGGVALALEGVLLRTGATEAPSAPGPRRSPVAPPEASPPAEPGGGKPLFFLPLPTVVGRDGVGVGWGGVFF
jgi:hypothetical protein